MAAPLRVRGGTGRNFDGVPDQKHDVSAELTLNWNLFNGGSDQARVRQQTHLMNQAADFRDKACRDARQTAGIAFNDVGKRELDAIEAGGLQLVVELGHGGVEHDQAQVGLAQDHRQDVGQELEALLGRLQLDLRPFERGDAGALRRDDAKATEAARKAARADLDKKIAVMFTGRINDPVVAEDLVKGGYCDLVGMVRAGIALYGLDPSPEEPLPEEL